MSDSATRVRLCAVGDINPGEMLQVTPAGLPALTVYRVHDEFYCTQDTCTHAAASLGDDGELDGYIVECGWHEGQFDIRTGEACALPCVEPLETYPVVVDRGEVFIEVKAIG